jgi:hypothetical protein
MRLQPRLDAARIVGVIGKGVDAPDSLVFILLKDGLGRPLQQRVGIQRSGGGLGDRARPPRDYLLWAMGHFSNTAIMTNRDTRWRALLRQHQPIEPRGRGIHG